MEYDKEDWIRHNEAIKNKVVDADDLQEVTQ
jgi:hypothetical protein